jgi:hypothetical protein
MLRYVPVTTPVAKIRTKAMKTVWCFFNFNLINVLAHFKVNDQGHDMVTGHKTIMADFF